MKIAISSSGVDLEAQLDPRFGRCRNFLIIETDTMNFEVFDNKNAALGGGAGIQSAQLTPTTEANAAAHAGMGGKGMGSGQGMGRGRGMGGRGIGGRGTGGGGAR
jgi:predicted Fe-Mo cluster-binding NifX family protein